METRSIHFKSDFLVRLVNEVDWSTPFSIRFFTTRAVSAKVVAFDGENYVGCTLDESTGALLVPFERFTELYRQGLGTLRMELTYRLSNALYPDQYQDVVLPAQPVVCTNDQQEEFYLSLALTGDDDVEVSASVVAPFMVGPQGAAGTGISTMTQTSASVASAGANVWKMTLTDGREFLFTVLNGEKGDTGAQGPQGPQGAKGAKGDKGDKGDTGARGPQGEQGPRGVPGQRGEKGAKGDKGDRGLTGETGPAGNTPEIGQNGNWWIGGIDTGVKADYSGTEAQRQATFEANEADRDQEFASKEATRDAANEAALNCADELAALGPKIGEVKDVVMPFDWEAVQHKGMLLVTSTQKWSISSAALPTYVILPISGNSITIKTNADRGMQIAFLRSYTEPANEDTPDFSTQTGYTQGLSVTTANTTKTYDIPSDVHYLYLLAQYNATANFIPASIVIDGVNVFSNINANLKTANQRIAALEVEAAKINSIGEDVNKLKTDVNINVRKGWIASTVWANMTSTQTPNHIIVAIPNVGTLTVVAGTNNAQIAFLRSYSNPSNGDTPDFSAATGFTSRISVSAGTTGTYTIPSDVKYLYALNDYNTTNMLPASIKVDGCDIFTQIKENVAVALASAKSAEHKASSFDDTINRVGIAQTSDTSLTQTGKYIDSDGNIASHSAYILRMYALENNKTYRLRFHKGGASLGAIAWGLYSSSSPSSSTLISKGMMWSQTPNGGKAEIKTTQAGCYLVTTDNFVYNSEEYIINVDELVSGDRIGAIEDKVSTFDTKITAAENGIKLLDVVPNVTKLYPNAELPVINFQFDYNSDESMTDDAAVVALFENYGVRCGFGLRDAATMSDARLVQMRDFQRRGHTIFERPGSAIITTDNFASVQEVYTHIMGYHTNSIKAGFVVNGFAAPSSTYAPEYIDAVKRIYAYGATYQDSGANGRSSNPCNTIRINLELSTRANIRRRILEWIAGDKIIPLYGHIINFGTTGQSITSTMTIAAVDITNGSGTIRTSSTMPLNPETASGVLTRSQGSGDSEITYSDVSIDSSWTYNTITVSGVTTPPSVGDKYTHVTSDVWNIAKLTDVLQFVMSLEANMQCKVMSPDDAFKYYFKL